MGMNIQDWLQTSLIVGSISSALVAFIWVALKLDKTKHTSQDDTDDYGKNAKKEVEHIFNDEFREELRNRGRLHFEKIIDENAMFLQQDLRLTTSQINEYMKQEITKTLHEAFVTYEQSISDAKKIAIESIEKTQAAVEDQRKMLSDELTREINEEKKRALERFNQNMTEIVNHYIVSAIGNQIDLNDQLEYILGELERNKQVIIEDILSGA